MFAAAGGPTGGLIGELTLKLLPHLTRAARGGAGPLVLIFAFLLWLASYAGLLGISLALIVGSWFFKYAYVLFDHVVRGYDEPPALDINMVNPANEQRPLAQLAILLLLALGVYALGAFYSRPLAWCCAGLALLTVPASVAVLGLEGNPFKALWPPALWHMIRGLGHLYLGVLLFIGIVALLLAGAQRLHVWMALSVALGMFSTLTVFSVLGGALYERRHELGLEVWHSPERTAEKARVLEVKESERQVAEAYGLARVGEHINAWKMLQDWLSARGQTVEDYRWLVPRVSSWPDPRYADRLTQEYVARLLALRLTGEALDAVSQRLRVSPGFRPKTANATFQIAQLALRGGGASGVARALLQDFGTRFPDDPQAEAANALLRELGERRSAE
jgi:hypothetical protein